MDVTTLTDKQLREKCLYFGLQNVPINDETRDLVVNKVREHIKAETSKNEEIKGRQVKLLTQASRSKKAHEYYNLPEERVVEKFKIKTKQMSDHQILTGEKLQKIRKDDERRREKNKVRKMSDLKKALAVKKERLAIPFDYKPPEKEQFVSTDYSKISDADNAESDDSDMEDYDGVSKCYCSPCQSNEQFYSIRSKSANFYD